MAHVQPNHKDTLKILVIEDSEDDALLLVGCFRRAGYIPEFKRVDNANGTRQALLAEDWDAILSDHSMPGFNALSALALMQELNLDLPFIIVSGVIDEETAIAAMRAGAHDYLSKDRLDRLVPAVEREMREATHRAERRSALAAVQENEARFRSLVSNIPGMVFQLLHTLDGGLRFLYVSEGSTTLLGRTPASLTSSSHLFFDAIHADDRDSIDSALSLSSAKLTQVNWDGRIRSADGALKWINLRSAPRCTASNEIQWEGIASNITQSKLAESELRESRAQLAELSSHLEAAKEEERERIARDIHDELGGTLVAIKIETSLLSNKLPSDPLQLRKRVRGIEGLIDEAMNTAGRVARELRPGILKDFGLAAAIECQADDFSQRVGLNCDTQGISHEIDPDEKTSLALFRIFQEALTNVAKHAQATRVSIRLDAEGNNLVLEISDNGRGISAEDMNKPKSFGLRGIQERMRGLGGSLELARNSPQGSRVILRAPYKPNLAVRQDSSQ
ncbi:MAG: response regulator [Rhodocyclaceae bacterium]|nr:response regulator [Rhodocyclaceae bacterium]MCP5297409.1 response regulator [Zoogloeaceae bacterium]MCW5596458.1 response regulator [Rhodocyclaceae bacterium]